MARPAFVREILHLALLAAVAAAAVALAFDLVNGFPHGLTYDDAYFYAKIAYNIGVTGRSSFDGVTATSGYHLLWGGVLAGVSALLAPLTVDRMAHLFAHEVTFVALALAVARRFFMTAVERSCAVVLVVMGTLLMETLLLSGLLLVLAKAETRSAGPGEGLGAAGAAAFLVPLARIDASLIVAVYAALLALEGRRRRGGTLAAALGLGIAAQLALMVWLFGEPFSVSAMIKAADAAPSGARAWASIVGPGDIALGHVVRFALFAGLAAAAIGVGVAGRASAVNRRLLYLSLGAAAFSGGHVVAQMVPFWCYLPAHLVLFFAVTHGEARAPALLLARRVVVVGVAILGLAFAGHKAHLYASNRDVIRGAREFVDGIARHVPPDGRIYQVDGSGFTGFFSGRAVVNGDGLVNSYEYARRAREGRLAGYLGDHAICYVITNVASADGVLVNHGGLRVEAAGVEEVLRSRTYGRFSTTDFVLYRRCTPECGPHWDHSAPARTAPGRAVVRFAALPRG